MIIMGGTSNQRPWGARFRGPLTSGLDDPLERPPAERIPVGLDLAVRGKSAPAPYMVSPERSSSLSATPSTPFSSTVPEKSKGFVRRRVWHRQRKRPLCHDPQDLFEYVSSHITLEAIMKAEMERRWPEEPPAVGKRAFSLRKRISAAKVTDTCIFVRWRV
jgi:hypothetical protein